MKSSRIGVIALVVFSLELLPFCTVASAFKDDELEESLSSLKEEVNNLKKTLHQGDSVPDQQEIDSSSSCSKQSDKPCKEERGKGRYHTDENNVPPEDEKALNSDRDARMVLRDKYGELQYKVEYESGPSHAPIFAAQVTVQGQTFKGSGSSKKKAKLSAAESACKGLKLNC